MAKKNPITQSLSNLELDPYQKKVMKHEGHCALRCGRQTGKSTVVALKAHKLANENPGTNTLVIASVQRQSGLLFEKIKSLFDEREGKILRTLRESPEYQNTPKSERKYLEKEASIYLNDPTLTRIELKNGSNIFCHPTGRTGSGIRGFTVDFLIADEAHYIPDEVWVAVVPMMATSKKQRGFGWMILLSTPKGRHGYFYDVFKDPDFLHIHVSSEKCKRITKKFLSRQRSKLTKMQYAQEYLAEFVEGYDQFFASELVDKASSIDKWNLDQYNHKANYFLGVDVARYGGDQNAFVVAEIEGEQIKIVYCETTENKALTDTIGRIKELHGKFKFAKILIDGSGVGGGVVDVLINDLGRKIIEINNSSRAVDLDEKQHKILKEDLYSTTLVCFEQERIKMINFNPLKFSLKGIRFEYTENARVKIHGKSSHLAEALVRAVWGIKLRINPNLFI